MNLYDLKTNNRKENNNVGRQNPVFGWRVKSDRGDIFQESYRIRICGQNCGKRKAYLLF